MSTVIDKLVVALSLDNTLFRKGIKESEHDKDAFEGKNKRIDKSRSEAEKKAELQKQAYQKNEQARNRQTIDGFTKLRNEAIAFLTIFTAGKGILSFVEDTITSTAALGRLSENINVSVSDLAGLQFAMKEVGGTAEGATGAIDKAAAAVGAWKTGMPNQAKEGLFTMAGGTGLDLSGAFKDAKSFMLAEADVLKVWNKRDPTQALLMARQMLGVDPETFNLLKQGRQELEKQMTKGAAMTGIDKHRADASRRMQQEWVEISARLENVGQTLMMTIAPTVFHMLDRLAAWAGNKENLKAMSGYMEKFAKTMEGMDFTKLGEAATSGFRGIIYALEALLEVANKLHDLGLITTVAGTGIVTGTNPLGVKSSIASYSDANPFKALYQNMLGGSPVTNVSVGLIVTAPQGTKVEAHSKSPSGAVHVVHQANVGMHP
jgi:hypothetical protein